MFEHQMSNDDLQRAILHTITAIRFCDPSAKRKPLLELHLKDLLAIQRARATRVVVDP